MGYQHQIYSNDYVSGTNVTVSMGPCILTQAAGLEYSVEQLKRPLYGYHSQRFDAVAKGLIQVNGRLILNFVSPRYLTITIQRYITTMYAWLHATDTSNLRQGSLVEYLQNDPQARSLFSAMSRQLDIPIESMGIESGDFLEPNTEPFRYQIESSDGTLFNVVPELNFQMGTDPQDFSTLLDEFFASDQSVDGLTKLIWGDVSSQSQFNKQYSVRNILNQGTSEEILTTVVSHIRPDQMGDATDGIQGIDITVLYGHPFEDQVTSTSFRYDHSSARVFKNVHFIGESETIYSNSEPILDSYSFFCRDVHSLSGGQLGIRRS
jgi:hypothetical protein